MNDNPQLDEITQKLFNYRLRNAIPQEKLAEMLGVAFSTVNRWFNGRSRPSHIHKHKIAKLLGGGNDNESH